jgi:hypothetical protein
MSCTRRTFLTAASGLALGTPLAASTHNRIRVSVVGALRPDLQRDGWSDEAR